LAKQIEREIPQKLEHFLGGYLCFMVLILCTIVHVGGLILDYRLQTARFIFSQWTILRSCIVHVVSCDSWML